MTFFILYLHNYINMGKARNRIVEARSKTNMQKEQKYYFKFLSPRSFDLFFKALSNGTYKDFKSELEAKLEE